MVRLQVIGFFVLVATCFETTAMAKDAPKKKSVTKPKVVEPATPPSQTEPKASMPVSEPASQPTHENKEINAVHESRGDGPFAKQPSPFGDIVDQSTIHTGQPAKILRVNQPFFGGKYSIATGDNKVKSSKSSSKTKVDLNSLQAMAIYPLPVGLRIGAMFSDSNLKVKSDNITAKMSAGTKGILAAAAFHNGFGFGVGLYDVNASASVLSVDRDDHYAYLWPSIFFASEKTEIELSYRQSMRHEVNTEDGEIEMNLEHDFGGMNGLLRVTHYRRAENDDDEKNSFDVGFGTRFLITQKSFILAQLNLSESHNRSPASASVSTIAQQSLDISSDWWVAPQHVIGGHFVYTVGSGKGGKNASNNQTKYETNAYGLEASYSFRM